MHLALAAKHTSHQTCHLSTIDARNLLRRAAGCGEAGSNSSCLLNFALCEKGQAGGASRASRRRPFAHRSVATLSPYVCHPSEVCAVPLRSSTRCSWHEAALSVSEKRASLAPKQVHSAPPQSHERCTQLKLRRFFADVHSLALSALSCTFFLASHIDAHTRKQG